MLLFGLILLSCEKNVDLIVYNTKVYDLDSETIVATAVVIDRGKFIEMGSDSLRHVYKATEIIDAKGKLLLPGFNDAHAHVIGAGLTMQNVDLSTCTSKQETLDKVTQFIKDVPAGTWVTGRGWNQELWDVKEWPSAHELDAISKEHPIYLRRVDGHSGWANSLAMSLSGVTDTLLSPEGGEIKRDNEGKAIGIFVDAAEMLIQKNIPKPNADQLTKAALDAQNHLLRMGVTSVTEIGPDHFFAIYSTLLSENKLSVRVNFIPDYKKNLQPFQIEQPEWLNVQYSKVYMDGSLGSRSAWLTHPYEDEPTTSGLPQHTDSTLRAILEDLYQKNLKPAIHAIGDQGNQRLLELYNEHINKHQILNSRYRVEHAQILNETCYDLFVKGGVIASMQPKHCISDMLWAENRLGKKRSEHAYPWKSVLDKKIHLAFGTDWPIEPVNPFYGVYGAVTRQFLGETQENTGWVPKEKLSVGESIYAYTSGSAYAENMEDEKGKIKTGHFADFILVNEDIFRISPVNIQHTFVTHTFVNGELKYQKDELVVSKSAEKALE